MLVTDVGDEMCRWQLLDVGDDFGYFGHLHLKIVTNITVTFGRRLPVYLGIVNNNLKIEYGPGTTVSYGCAATFLGEFYYFGGAAPNKRQVSFFLWFCENLLS